MFETLKERRGDAIRLIMTHLLNATPCAPLGADGEKVLVSGHKKLKSKEIV